MPNQVRFVSSKSTMGSPSLEPGDKDPTASTDALQTPNYASLPSARASPRLLSSAMLWAPTPTPSAVLCGVGGPVRRGLKYSTKAAVEPVCHLSGISEHFEMYLLYNQRKTCGDTVDRYFKSTELISGVKVMRF
ncbi:hypothetical protein CONPUDRAFT_159866 [Coniophora puteana RWD-64-598 SS2]|uniref:Uncharacterized protein n=1 Tax=Coniophora puteana (strain RWD-64-598) TaxID=741705 RepID=R7SFR1_CONPW|nr:uncharacterized protein CONPUDRAFT_159866 [Coniophora puteana RWD-64-598 SS2]EIW74577.1 hypothetical protein CONPUDRAFT_159866 [Coniophora puteana RWD-64-598 SS2]